MTVHPLYEGSFSVDVSKKFIPFDPAIHQAKDRPASIFIYVQPFLVKMGTDLILLDTGLGHKSDDGEFIVHKNIRKAGFSPDDVTLVIMSHLHNDHAAGLAIENNGGYMPAFPKAKHVIQKQEWAFALSGKSSSYPKELFEALDGKIDLELIDGSGEYKPGIRYELTGAHCPYHQVIWLEADNEIVFFGGDVLPEPEQAIRKFIAKYDYDGKKAADLREEYAQAASNNRWLCLFYHGKSRATGRIEITDTAKKVV